jgi:acylphosphatase
MEALCRVCVYFSGRVQGVGFRFTTRQIAQEYEVSGYVRNLTDGRVQVVAQGRPAEVDAFLEAVAERLHGHIRKQERSNMQAPWEEAFSDFSIR